TARPAGGVARAGAARTRDRAEPTDHRHPRPPPHVAGRPGDAESAGRHREEPFRRQDLRGGRALGHELLAEPELAAELDRPGLADEERVRAGLQLQIAHPDRPDHAARAFALLQDEDLEAATSEPVREGEPRDAGTDDDDPA